MTDKQDPIPFLREFVAKKAGQSPTADDDQEATITPDDAGSSEGDARPRAGHIDEALIADDQPAQQATPIQPQRRKLVLGALAIVGVAVAILVVSHSHSSSAPQKAEQTKSTAPAVAAPAWQSDPALPPLNDDHPNNRSSAPAQPLPAQAVSLPVAPNPSQGSTLPGASPALASSAAPDKSIGVSPVKIPDSVKTPMELATLKSTVDSVVAKVSIQEKQLSDMASSIDALKQTIDALTKRLDAEHKAAMQHARALAAASNPPSLRVKAISRTEGCSVCQPHAIVVSHARERLIGTGDRIGTYIAQVTEDRVILHHGKNQFSYYVDKKQ